MAPTTIRSIDPVRISGHVPWLLLAVLAMSACGGGNGPGSQIVIPGGGANGTGGSGNSAATGNGSGGFSTGTGGAGVVLDGGPNGSGGLSADSACAAAPQTAQLSPVDMFIQFDRSGSMNQNNKWPQASAALTAFFQDPSTAGLGVALRFFPHDLPVAGCTNANQNGCDNAACGEPLVPLGTLLAEAAPTDVQEGLLVQGVNMSAPGAGNAGNGGGTPLFAALAGALQWATAHQAAVPDHKSVVILVTDGQPNGCDESIPDIAQLAADAFQSSGVRTYAIGIQGSQQQTMDSIAMAGGTMAGFFIGNAANTQADLIAALNAIRGSVVSCDFALPTPPAGQDLDTNQVNVNYTLSGGVATPVGRADSAQACGNGDGWYYDNPTSPTRMLLCPATCTKVQADPMVNLQVLLGCATIPA